METFAYHDLLTFARRYSRNAAEARDLVQEALLIALESGRLAEDSDRQRAWLRGVIRKQAAMMVRTATRRRQRERQWQEALIGIAPRTTDAPESGDTDQLLDQLARLPPAARQVAVLAVHGLNAREIRWLLDLSATAFRQRLTSIRRGLDGLPDELRGQAMALARAPRRVDPDLELGLMRRALLAEVRRAPGIGAHDPDGHLLVLRRGDAHTSGTGGNQEGEETSSTGEPTC